MEKWGRVVDDVVRSAVDIRKIKDALKSRDYEEAILLTIQHYNCDLISVLRKHDLNSAAGS